MLKKITFLGLIFMVSACSGSTPSTRVQAMQKKDKQLTCKEVLLEMNEAQFYQQMAQKNKGPQLKNILMPLGYISTYMNAEEAINTASARVDYLDKIYGIMDCEAQKNNWQSQASYYQQNQGFPQGNPQLSAAPYPAQTAAAPFPEQANAAQYMGTSYADDRGAAPVGQVRMMMPAPVPTYHYQDEPRGIPVQERMY